MHKADTFWNEAGFMHRAIALFAQMHPPYPDSISQAGE